MNSAEKKIIIPEIAIPRPDQLESNVGQEEAKEYAHEFNKIKLDSIKQLIIKTNSSKGFLGYLLYGNS